MKALVLEEYGRFVYKEMPTPEPGPEEVLVRVAACGICGSDVHGMDGSSGRRLPPLIMGHEAAGVIARVGAAVSVWQEGDRVTFDSTIYCSRCHYCRRGLTNLCDHRRVLGVATQEFRQHGALAEYVAIPQHILYRLPDGLPFEQATMVESLAIAFHAVGRAPITLNDTAVVVGAGMIGLLVVQALRVAGCGRIIAVDLDPARLELARTLGADETVEAAAVDAAAEVLERTAGRGADLAYEVVGIAPTVQTAIGCLRKGGSLVLVGNLAPQIDFPLQRAVTSELTLYGSCSASSEFQTGLDMLRRGAVRVEPLISAVAPLAEGAAWFARLHRREPGLLKVVLRP